MQGIVRARMEGRWVDASVLLEKWVSLCRRQGAGLSAAHERNEQEQSFCSFQREVDKAIADKATVHGLTVGQHMESAPKPAVEPPINLASLPKELWALTLAQLTLRSQERCALLCKSLRHEASRTASATAAVLKRGLLETCGADEPFELADALEANRSLLCTAAHTFGTLRHLCGRPRVHWRWRAPPGRAFNSGLDELPFLKMGRDTRVLHGAVLRLVMSDATRHALAHSEATTRRSHGAFRVRMRTIKQSVLEATFQRSWGGHVQDRAVSARVQDLEVLPPASGFWTCKDVIALRDRVARERLQPHLRALAKSSEEYGPRSEWPADSVVALMRVRSVSLEEAVIEVGHYVYHREHYCINN